MTPSQLLGSKDVANIAFGIATIKADADLSKGLRVRIVDRDNPYCSIVYAYYEEHRLKIRTTGTGAQVEYCHKYKKATAADRRRDHTVGALTASQLDSIRAIVDHLC